LNFLKIFCVGNFLFRNFFVLGILCEVEFFTTVEPRYSAIEGSEKFSHKIEVNFEGFLVEGTKNFSHYIEVQLY
jgi:hypothetical protein